MSTTNKLKAAAEELVKAAYLDSNADANKETIDSLKGLETHLVAWKTSMDAKVNTVNQNMDNLKDALTKGDSKLSELKLEVTDLKLEVTDLKRTQLLAAGIQNCFYNSFKYYEDLKEISSETLVRHILFSFQKGMGLYISNVAALQKHGISDSEEKVRKSQQGFRDSLVDQIHALTGEKPRIAEPSKAGANYAIYKS
jgi:hypothetical protein